MAQDATQMNRETPEGTGVSAKADDGPQVQEARRLIAYRLLPKGPKLVPAWVNRAWMDATPDRWAYRCLPLNVANEAGWMVLNPREVEVTWNGNARQDGLRVKFFDGPPTSDVLSMFGHGIVTWRIPYLFRTPPGYNLLVRGPANIFKEAASPLEGLVESDWAVTSFTIELEDHDSFLEGEVQEGRTYWDAGAAAALRTGVVSSRGTEHRVQS